MDIFTTQLTRVVAVPIKPVSLKVKALAKDAATDKLTDDLDHLENHDQYFEKEDNEKHQTSEHECKKSRDDNDVVYEKEKRVVNTSPIRNEDDDDVHHFDLFI
jgi:hypothetical protein